VVLYRKHNSVFQIGYHIVWCVMYRKEVLTGGVVDDVKELLLQIARENGFTIEQLQVMSDHIHLFVAATPNHLVTNMVKSLKGVSARLLLKKRPELKEQLWGGCLWNPSYYVGTVGYISEETVNKYIESQKAGD